MPSSSSRRTICVLIILLGLASLGGCTNCQSNKDNLVVIKYKALGSFKQYYPLDYWESGQLHPDKILNAGDGMWMVYEVTRIENTGKDAVPFNFIVGNLHSSSGSTLLQDTTIDPTNTSLIPLLVPLTFTDSINPGEIRNYPLSEPVLSGPWCQSLQHIRFIIKFDDVAAGDESAVGPLFYKSDTPAEIKSLVVNANPGGMVTFRPAVTGGELINYIFGQDTFFGNCDPPSENAGTGQIPAGGRTPDGTGGSGGPTPGADNPGGDAVGGGSAGGRLPRQVFTFCVTAPGSGAQPEEISVLATSPAEALAHIKSENLPDGGIGYNITVGPCPKRPSP